MSVSRAAVSIVGSSSGLGGGSPQTVTLCGVGVLGLLAVVPLNLNLRRLVAIGAIFLIPAGFRVFCHIWKRKLN